MLYDQAEGFVYRVLLFFLTFPIAYGAHKNTIVAAEMALCAFPACEGMATVCSNWL